MGVGTLRGIRIEHALVGDVAALMGHPPRASIRRYAASGVYLLLGGCGADTDTADSAPPIGLLHVAKTTTGDYMDIEAGFALRENGEIVDASGETSRYASVGEVLCTGRTLASGYSGGPPCTIADGVVSAPDEAGHYFDWARFAGATRVGVISFDARNDFACATGPAVSPCQGDTSALVDEAAFLASLPSAMDIKVELLYFVVVLEADGSLAYYSPEIATRDPPVPDAAGLGGQELVLDNAGGLWRDGMPVWLGESAPGRQVAAANEFVIAFDDGTTWFQYEIAPILGEAGRLQVVNPRAGVQFPIAPVALEGYRDFGTALVDGDLWVWAVDGYEAWIDWDRFEPQEPQVLGWE